MKKSIIALLFVGLFVISSCKKPDDGYEIPTAYNFENVDFSGQTKRLSMLAELSAYAKSANAVGANPVDATILKNMYANAGDPFADTTLNSSGKQLKDKTVSTEQTVMEAIMDALALASDSTNNNAPQNGVAGVATDASGTKHYLLNANGVELAQVLEKGLMGACFYYQATAVYFGSGKMAVDNLAVTPGQGTNMEHHWDEAFGYFGVPTDFPTNTTDLKFWGKYCNEFNGSLGLNTTIMNGFLAGRAAISNDDLPERDVKITTIRRGWELLCAGSALHYINEALESFTTDAAIKHHTLSEAYAFIYSLKWGGDATISSADVDVILNALGASSDPLQANFYIATETGLENAKTALVNAFAGLNAVKDTI